ncbi:prepilin-type N-terminal cleavage/methylation domain-containing protein [Candidatus Gottesmanbacteria bacterium]|nr:prepilin-type N-terminal cleavage/methylation domain-containing protein [Candidatus Gottesmanbacteria bacterium]
MEMTNSDLRITIYELRKKRGHALSFAEGFTLLEVLVSVSIIAVLSLLIAQSFFTTSRSNTKTEILKEVKQNGDFSLSRMSTMIRSSYQITSACSAAGMTASSLSIKNSDGGTTTFGCTVNSGVTRISSASGSVTDYLTSTSVSLGGTGCTDSTMTLQFVCTSLPNGGSSVKISFTLSQKGTPVALFEQAKSSFQTTIGLRNK